MRKERNIYTLDWFAVQSVPPEPNYYTPLADPRQRAREPQPVYLLLVRPEGPGAPPILRLRKGLKLLLRACGLRAIEHREIIPGSKLAAGLMALLSASVCQSAPSVESATDQTSTATPIEAKTV